jgi:hydrogenase maturation protease
MRDSPDQNRFRENLGEDPSHAIEGVPCRALIVGVGNDHGGDDGAGRVVARILGSLSLERVRIVELGGDLISLLELWKGEETVVLIDAVESGAPAGSIHCLDAGPAGGSRGSFRHSTHELGVGEVITLALTLGRLPPRLHLFGIEGKCFTMGERMSPEVEVAAREVAGRILEMLGGRSPEI